MGSRAFTSAPYRAQQQYGGFIFSFSAFLALVIKAAIVAVRVGTLAARVAPVVSKVVRLGLKVGSKAAKVGRVVKRAIGAKRSIDMARSGKDMVDPGQSALENAPPSGIPVGVVKSHVSHIPDFNIGPTRRFVNRFTLIRDRRHRLRKHKAEFYQPHHDAKMIADRKFGTGLFLRR